MTVAPESSAQKSADMLQEEIKTAQRKLQDVESRCRHWRMLAGGLGNNTSDYYTIASHAEKTIEENTCELIRRGESLESTAPAAEFIGKNRYKSWDEIDISFLSEERVQVTGASEGPETSNYAEFGFQDNRNGKPNRAWATLLILAKNDGVITQSVSNSEKWRNSEKRMQEIRRIFKDRFGLAGNPLPYVRNVGYKAQFKVRCAPSFET
ncbi:MAG: hypothetical protein WB630_23740 [Candidatus Acidiferrales bacterium]